MQSTGTSFDGFLIVQSFLTTIHQEMQLRWPAEVAGKKEGLTRTGPIGVGTGPRHRQKCTFTAQRPNSSALSSSPRRHSLRSPGPLFWSADDPPSPANIRGSVETALSRAHPLHSGHVGGHHFFLGHSSTRLSTNHAFSAPSNLCPSASSQLCFSIDQRQSALKPSYYPGQS